MATKYGPKNELTVTDNDGRTWNARTVISYTQTSLTETSITYNVNYGVDFDPVRGSSLRRRSLRARSSVPGDTQTTFKDNFTTTSSPYWFYETSTTLGRTTSAQEFYATLCITKLTAEFYNSGSSGITDIKKYTRTNGSSESEELRATLSSPALNTYTVSFDANGHGTAPESQTVYYGYTATKPTELYATGWKFEGWYTEPTCVNYWSFSTVVTGNTKLYAKWTPRTYYIYYDDNGGTGTVHRTVQSKRYDRDVTLHSTTADGFEKVDTTDTGAIREYVIKSKGGWLSNYNSRVFNPGATLGGSTIAQDITMTAQWEPKYIYPTIKNLTAIRTATATSDDEDDDGEYLRISFDWTGYSSNNGSSFTTPTCEITVDGNTETVTLTGSSPNNFVYRPTNPSIFSSDETHTVSVLIYNSASDKYKASASIVIPTAILPIDLYGKDSAVYMGIMHPYVTGQVLTVPDLYIDTENPTGIDAEIRTVLNSLGWSDVLS